MLPVPVRIDPSNTRHRPGTCAARDLRDAAMLILTCPYCGVAADETELAPGGEAHLTRQGPGSSDEDFEAYLFDRRNPKGIHIERWRHAYGCGKWFHAVRDTVTMQVFGTYPAQTTEPPQDIMAKAEGRG